MATYQEIDEAFGRFHDALHNAMGIILIIGGDREEALNEIEKATHEWTRFVTILRNHIHGGNGRVNPIGTG